MKVHSQGDSRGCWWQESSRVSESSVKAAVQILCRHYASGGGRLREGAVTAWVDVTVAPVIVWGPEDEEGGPRERSQRSSFAQRSLNFAENGGGPSSPSAA